MSIKFFIFLGALLCSMASLASESIYCPQGQRYIRLGMSADEVLAACGQPLSIEKSNSRATERVPVKQLIYSTLNEGSFYSTLDPIYNLWSLPSGSTGITMKVSIINQKITGITIDGDSSNAMSLCNGASIEVGDDESKMYQACGNPTMINNTFINQPITSKEKPQIWRYQLNPYQPPISLTIVDGKLQSIQ